VAGGVAGGWQSSGRISCTSAVRSRRRRRCPARYLNSSKAVLRTDLRVVINVEHSDSSKPLASDKTSIDTPAIEEGRRGTAYNRNAPRGIGLQLVQDTPCSARVPHTPCRDTASTNRRSASRTWRGTRRCAPSAPFAPGAIARAGQMQRPEPALARVSSRLACASH
jgi:hypothetical protein